MAADGDEVVVVVYFGEAVAEATDEGIYGLLGYAFAACSGPDDFDDFISAADRAIGLDQHFEQAELGEREGGVEFFVVDDDGAACFVEGQASFNRGWLEGEGDGGVGADEEHFDAKGDLDFVAVLDGDCALHLTAVEVGSVFAAEVLEEEAAVLAQDFDVVAGDLAFGQNEVAVVAAADDEFVYFYCPALSG